MKANHAQPWIGFGIGLGIGIFASASAEAGQLTLPTLNQSDVDTTSKTLASDLSFRPLEPASTFGDVFGVSFGAEANTTSTSQIASLLPNGPKYIPNGSLFFALQLPLGLGLEAGIIPKITYDGVQFKEYGGAVKWTFSKLFHHSPVDLAVRGLYSNASLNFGETLDSANVNVGYTTQVYGGSLGISKTFLFIEPYADVGLLKQSSTVTGSGTVSLFDTTFPVGTESATSSSTSPFVDVGVQLHLTVLQLTGEYSDRFGSSAFAAKLSFKF